MSLYSILPHWNVTQCPKNQNLQLYISQTFTSSIFCLLLYLSRGTGRTSKNITRTFLFFSSIPRFLKPSIVCKDPRDAKSLVPMCTITSGHLPVNFTITANYAITSHVFTSQKQHTFLWSLYPLQNSLSVLLYMELSVTIGSLLRMVEEPFLVVACSCSSASIRNVTHRFLFLSSRDRFFGS